MAGDWRARQKLGVRGRRWQPKANRRVCLYKKADGCLLIVCSPVSSTGGAAVRYSAGGASSR